MDKLKLLKLAENQDVEAFEAQDFEQEEQNAQQAFKKKYFDEHDDVKQPCKHIKEDW